MSALNAAVRHVDVGRLFEASTRRFAQRPAIVWDGGSRSYGDLGDRAMRIAGTLKARGVQPGDRVLLMFANGCDFIEAWWAAVLLGAVVVPLTSRATHTDLARAIAVAGPRAVLLGDVAGAKHHAALADRREGLLVVSPDRAAGDLTLSDMLDAAPLTGRQVMPLDAPCAMYFTAGSTGDPKGVVRSQQSVLWGLSMLAQKLGPDDVLVARAPMGHTGGSLTGPFAVMVAGGTLVIPSASDADSILDAVENFKVTHLYVHPTAFAKAMLQSLQARPRALASLKRLQWTAGPMPESVRDQIFERFPHLPLEVTYGMTEASNLASYVYDVPHGVTKKAANCVGFALPGGMVRVVDADGVEVPRLVEGHVETRTATAFDGYWNDVRASAAAISADGWFRTGDVGYLDEDCALHLSGRQKEIIKSGGMSVHPYEVEQILTEHASVGDVVVFGRPDDKWDEAVIAAVTLRPGISPASITELDLISYCRDRLPGYKVPKVLRLLSDLPRNSSGKVDRKSVISLMSTLHKL